MSRKGPVVIQGMLDFEEDFFFRCNTALNLLLYPFHLPDVDPQRK